KRSNHRDCDYFASLVVTVNIFVDLLNLENYPNAIPDFTQAIEINPNYLDAYYNRGCCYFYIQDYQAAINDFSFSIQINPQYLQAYSARANSYIALGEITKAELDFQKVKELGG
ncbi:MAG: tetratricopeptide repeat protein, partial [Cyanobacteria bacterium J06641_2]